MPEENRIECTANSNVEARVAASPLRQRELDEINRVVNQEITPETDLEHYGVNEYWTVPTDGRGDCEDYALLKRHKLMQLGWPSSALLMTVVTDESGEGHAVLTARTTAGISSSTTKSMTFASGATHGTTFCCANLS